MAKKVLIVVTALLFILVGGLLFVPLGEFNIAFAIAGFLVWLVGFSVMYGVHQEKQVNLEEGTKTCRQCKEKIHIEADSCPHCTEKDQTGIYAALGCMAIAAPVIFLLIAWIASMF